MFQFNEGHWAGAAIVIIGALLLVAHVISIKYNAAERG